MLSLVGCLTFAQSLKVVIKQDGQVIEPVNNVYELKKKPFQFELAANDLEDFLVGVTTDEDHFGEAVDFFEDEEPWFTNTGIAEGLFNEEQELYLMDMAPFYWYYTDKDEHCFDRDPVGTAEEWTATRTISKVYDLISSEDIALKDIQDSIYIYMFYPSYDEDLTMIEKQNLFFGELRFINE